MKNLFVITFVVCVFSGCQVESVDNPSVTSEAVAGELTEYEKGSIITLTGRLISPICFGDENPENHDDSLECAVKNTNTGAPVAVLEEGKSPHDAWILLTVPQIFEDYLGQTVRVTGGVTSQGVLTPTRVEWKKGDGWAFIM